VSSLTHEAAVWRDRAWTVTRVLRAYVVTRWQLHKLGLPGAVRAAQLGSSRRVQPGRLSRQVSLVLRFGGERNTRCIHRAVVLHRLLAEQGEESAVVIGLRPGEPTTRAHAWVEWRGHDLGPAPGRGDHVELARFP